jgi:hypothetical protein
MRSHPTPRATTYSRLAVKVALAVRWRHAQPISRSDTAEICPVQRSWMLLSLTGHLTGRISRDTFAQRSSLDCGGGGPVGRADHTSLADTVRVAAFRDKRSPRWSPTGVTLLLLEPRQGNERQRQASAHGRIRPPGVVETDAKSHRRNRDYPSAPAVGPPARAGSELGPPTPAPFDRASKGPDRAMDRSRRRRRGR